MTKYFSKPINCTDKFFKKLEKEGKVKTLNSRKYKIRQEEVNKTMEEVHRDYLSMNAGSIISARNFYIWHQQNYSFY